MDKKCIMILKTTTWGSKDAYKRKWCKGLWYLPRRERVNDREWIPLDTGCKASYRWTFDTIEEAMDNVIEKVNLEKTLLKFDDASDIIFRCTTYGYWRHYEAPPYDVCLAAEIGIDCAEESGAMLVHRAVFDAYQNTEAQGRTHKRYEFIIFESVED